MEWGRTYLYKPKNISKQEIPNGICQKCLISKLENIETMHW